MGAKLFRGTYTALATPFKNGHVDEGSFRRLLETQMQGNIDGFIVNGTTGESPTLTVEEVKLLVEWVRKDCPDKQMVLGVGTNNTLSSLEWIRRANEWGADGALAVVPYYNKPPQRGLIQHFETLAEASEVPVILYNVPGRTVQTLSAESIHVLSRHEKIAGVKESTGNLEFLAQIKADVPEDFSLLSGDDGTAVEFCLQGGDGVVGVVTHLIPGVFKNLIDRALARDLSARTKVLELKELIDSIYVEANPIPVKKALQLLGIFERAELRLPLVELTPELSERLTGCLQKHQVI